MNKLYESEALNKGQARKECVQQQHTSSNNRSSQGAVCEGKKGAVCEGKKGAVCEGKKRAVCEGKKGAVREGKKEAVCEGKQSKKKLRKNKESAVLPRK